MRGLNQHIVVGEAWSYSSWATNRSTHHGPSHRHPNRLDPRAEVFAVLADTAGIHRFHPFIERSPLHEGTPAQGVGSERTCHFSDGNSVSERVVAFEADTSLRIDIYEGTMPLNAAAAQFTLSDAPGGGTLVQMDMDYTPKFGVLGQAMDALVMRRKFTGMLDLLLAGLDEHLRTGAVIDGSFTGVAAA